ncbi:hypothetical protein CDT99_15485 [Cronobacter sakazakii]|nr:hypothetical protein CDT99_15485 [Cronobacter sakazakii]
MAGDFWRVRVAYPPYEISGLTFNVGWVSGAHPPFFSPGHKTNGKVMILLRLKKIGPSGPIFRQEPGLQRGRRRAPFARSRETSIPIKGTLWRTERVHRPGIYHLNTCLMAGALHLPALR